MNYNIDFDIVSAGICMIVLLFSSIQYTTVRLSNRRYRTMLICMCLGAILDAITGKTNSDPDMISLWLNMILNTAFFITSITVGYSYYRYVSAFIYNKKTRNLNDIINTIIVILYLLVLVFNVKYGLIFSLIDNVYEFGPLHVLPYILPSYFILNAFTLSLVYRSKFSRKQLIAVILFLPFSFVGMIVQMLFLPEVLVTYIFSTMGMVSLLFTLETPDYRALMQTMDLLEKAKIDAEAATKTKSEFLARMSHEIRTPINAVLGMDEMILRETKEPEIAGYAENIKSAGNALLSIINDVLDFSKIESGRFEILSVNYSVSGLIMDSGNLIRSRAEAKNLKVIIDNNPDMPAQLNGDEIRIRQIIVNLLTNAVKYTKEGSVKMKIDWEKQGDDKGCLTISVTDTGMGIAHENLDRIFNSFERADGKKNRAIEGTGLGLSITKQLVELMEGTITVESELDKGSVFTVRIPQNVVDNTPMGKLVYSENGVELSGGARKKDSLDAKKSNVRFRNENASFLVVDDVKMNLDVFKGLMKKSGAHTDSALSGKEGIELIKKNRYDMIFMDHLMPELDGIETLGLIRQLEDNPNKDTPIIVLTANVVSGAEENYRSVGFDGYLSKPVRYEELEKMICKYVKNEMTE